MADPQRHVSSNKAAWLARLARLLAQKLGRRAGPRAEPAQTNTCQLKILLLGSSESGKSTVVKQMRIIHDHGYGSDEERSAFRPIIIANVRLAAAALVRVLLSYADPSLLKAHEQDMGLIGAAGEADQEYSMLPWAAAEALQRLWHDERVQRVAICHSNVFPMMDSAPHFFQHALRIAKADYIPSVQDVLFARTVTSGICPRQLQVGNIVIQLVDVGGQRPERLKWIQCFDNVTSVIFCVSLIEYDQLLLEHEAQNRLGESIALFESIVNSIWFRRTSVILFLNKIDAFRIKLPLIPLENFYHDYVGGASVVNAVRYILFRFVNPRINRANLTIYPFVTEAISTANIRVISAAVTKTILENALAETSIL